MKKSKLLKLIFVTPMFVVPLVASGCSDKNPNSNTANNEQYLNTYSSALSGEMINVRSSFKSKATVMIKKTDVVDRAKALAKGVLSLFSNYNADNFNKISVAFISDNYLANATTVGPNYVFSFGEASVFSFQQQFDFGFTLTFDKTSLTYPDIVSGFLTGSIDFIKTDTLDKIANNIVSLNYNDFNATKDFYAASGKGKIYTGTVAPTEISFNPANAVTPKLPGIADNFIGTKILTSATNQYLFAFGSDGTLPSGPNRVAYADISGSKAGKPPHFDYVETPSSPSSADGINANIYTAGRAGSNFIFGTDQGVYGSSGNLTSTTNYTEIINSPKQITKMSSSIVKSTSRTFLGGKNTGLFFSDNGTSLKEINGFNGKNIISISSNGTGGLAVLTIIPATKTSSVAYGLYATNSFDPSKSDWTSTNILEANNTDDLSSLNSSASLSLTLTIHNSILLGGSNGLWYHPNLQNNETSERTFKFVNKQSILNQPNPIENISALTSSRGSSNIANTASVISLTTGKDIYYITLPNFFF